MSKNASSKPSTDGILAKIREAERAAKEGMERASAEGAQIVDGARRRAERESQRSMLETRSEIERLELEKAERSKAQVSSILREREEALKRQDQTARSNFPKAREVVLQRIAGMLND